MSDNKKVIIGIVITILLIIVIAVVINRRNNLNNNEEENINTEISYNNETGEYYIEDENGEILHSAYSEDELYIYQIDPDYDAKNPDSSLESQAMPEE